VASLACLAGAMSVRRVTLFGRDVTGANVCCRRSDPLRRSVVMKADIPGSHCRMSVRSYIFRSVSVVAWYGYRLRLLYRRPRCHLYSHFRRHHVARKAAQRQQSNHQGEEKNTHRLMIGQSAKKFPSL